MKSEISIKDKATQVIEKVKKGLTGVTQKVWGVTLTVMDKVTAPIKGIFNLLKSPIAFTMSLLGLETDAADLLETLAGFEESLAAIQDVAGDTKGFEKLKEKAREMGRETSKSANEAAEAMGLLAEAGWNEKNIELGIKPVLRLSEVGELELDMASALAASGMDSFGLEVEELEGFLDKIAKISEKTNADMGQLIEGFLEIGDTVRENNIGLDEASALMGVLAKEELTGAEAGAGLNSVLVNLTTGAGEAGEAMKKLGLNAASDKNFKGYAETLKDLYEKTKDMEEGQKDYYLTAIGGKMPLENLKKLLSGVGEGYDDLKKDILGSKGALEEMAMANSDNIYGDIEQLQGIFADMKIGFMDKFRPYIRKFIQWLTEEMAMVNKIVEKAAGFFSEKIENMGKRIEELTNSNDWGEMDLAEKILVAWDEVIMEPFSSWWDGTGKAWFSQKAEKIGDALGQGITTGLLVLLGFDLAGTVGGAAGEALDSGVSIGESFADGFLQGFDGQKVGEAILNAIKGIVKDAGTILPLGEEASSTSLLSTGLVLSAGVQAGKGIQGAYKGIQGAYKGMLSRFGKKGAGDLGSMVSEASSTAAMNVSAQVVNVYGGMVNNMNKVKNAATQIGTTAGGYALGNAAVKTISGTGRMALSGGSQALLTGTAATTMAKGAIARTYYAPLPEIAGKAIPTTSNAALAGLAKVGVALGSKATTIGGAALTGGLSAGGILAGGAGVVSGLKDIYNGVKMGGEEGTRKKWQGGTKVGMVGTGAIAGGIIGSVIPVVGNIVGATIGAGVGGIAALLKGSEIGDWFQKTFTGKEKEEEAARKAEREEKIRKEKEKQLAIEKQINDLKNTRLEISNTKEQIFATNQLKDAWSEINKELESGLLTEEEKIQKQEEMKNIVGELSELYPNIIDESDLENGKLDEKIGKIQGMNELEEERQKLTLENQLIEADRNFDSISEDFNSSNKNLEELRQKEQALKGDNQLELDIKIGELELYEQKLSNAISTQKDESILQEYEKMIEQKKQEIDEVLQKMGVINPFNQAFEALGIEEAPNMNAVFRHSYDSESINGEVQNSRESVNNQLIKELERNQKLQDQINQIYESSLQLIELNLGQPIEEAAKSYETMSEEQKKAFDQAMTGISDLNIKFQEFVKEPKYVDIMLKFDPRGAELLEIIDKMPQSDTKGPIAFRYAKGGIIKSPRVGMVAEAGAEAIIPLTGVNKQRGRTLWEQTGRILGMMPNEEGNIGIFDDVSKNRALQSPIYDGFFSDEEETDSQQTTSIVSAPIEIGGIHLGGMNFTFDGVGNGDRESMIEAIREQMPGIADEVADTIAISLTNLFSNMKVGIA